MTDTLTRLARIMHRLRLRSPATEVEKREWAAIRQAAGEQVNGPYTITDADVGKLVIRAFGRVWPVSGFLGSVLSQDVGKLVYRRGGVLQVENDEQRAARLAAVSDCECADAGCKAAPWHIGDGVCSRAGEMHLFRGSWAPTVFCGPCGDDALDSGVFVTGVDLSETEEARARREAWGKCPTCNEPLTEATGENDPCPHCGDGLLCSEAEELQIDALLGDILAP